MYSIFVDSSEDLVFGLLDSNFKWIEYVEKIEKKPSEILHSEIFNFISRYDLDLKNINFFFSSGPGSYTGMRLGEGLAQVLAWDHKKVFSFYHFDVPRILGIKKGFWVSNAFKKQIFIYNWDETINLYEKKLINTCDFKMEDFENGHTLSENKGDFLGLKSTKELIKNFPTEFFEKIFLKNQREKPYYFRTEQEEFK